MGDFAILAEVFRYPYAAQFSALRNTVKRAADPELRRELESFMARAQRRSQSEREALYTSTFDLNPTVAPYVGWHIWGEDYKRGAFLASLKHEQGQLGVEADGELPDHLVPVFRYLDRAARPLPDLLEVIAPALTKMRDQLKKANPENEYLIAVNAAIRVTESFVKTLLQKPNEEAK